MLGHRPGNAETVVRARPPPDLIQNDTLVQLVQKTDADGNLGSGPQYIYGPYLPDISKNALNEVSRVFRVNSAPPSSLSNRVGWVYHPASGQIWAGLYVGTVDLVTGGAEVLPDRAEVGAAGDAVLHQPDGLGLVGVGAGAGVDAQLGLQRVADRPGADEADQALGEDR
jgi:hypothetical protein